jgi:hypothetical protein
LAGSRLQLGPGEQLLVDIKPHWSFITGPLMVAVVVVAVGVTLDIKFPHTTVAAHWVEGLVAAVPCLWLAIRIVRWRTTRLLLTSDRLVEAWGVVRRKEWDVPLEQIASVTVVQSLPRRLMGTGRLAVVLWSDDRVRWIDDVRKPATLRRVITRRLGPSPDTAPSSGPSWA